MEEISPFSGIAACGSYRELSDIFIFVTGMTLTLSVGALLVFNGTFKLGLGAEEVGALIQGTLYIFTCLHVLKAKRVDFQAVFRDWRAKAGSDALNALKYCGIYLLIIAVMLGLAMLAVHLAGRPAAALVKELGSRGEMYAGAKAVMGVARPRFILMLFSFCVLAPAGEELFFRRALYPTLRNKLGFPRAFFASSVIFAATHGTASFTVFPVSLLLVYVYEKKRRLPVNIMLHGFINLFVMCVRLS
jgi:membrane protease YdiL (CAAX protease family)